MRNNVAIYKKMSDKAYCIQLNNKYYELSYANWYYSLPHLDTLEPNDELKPYATAWVTLQKQQDELTPLSSKQFVDKI